MISQSSHNNPRNFLFQNVEFFILGLTTLIFIIIVLIIAVRLINTYRVNQTREHLFAGIAYFGMASVWLDTPFTFIIILAFNAIPPPEVRFFLDGGLITITNFFWIMSILSLSKMNTKTRKVILVILGLFAVIIEVLYLYVVFTNWTLLGHFEDPIYADYSPLLDAFLTFHLISFIIPGFWLSLNSLKSNKDNVKLKGKLLTLSLLILIIGCIMQLVFVEFIIYLIGQIIVTISALFFYYGYILPSWIQILFLKKTKT